MTFSRLIASTIMQVWIKHELLISTVKVSVYVCIKCENNVHVQWCWFTCKKVKHGLAFQCSCLRFYVLLCCWIALDETVMVGFQLSHLFLFLIFPNDVRGNSVVSLFLFSLPFLPHLNFNWGKPQGRLYLVRAPTPKMHRRRLNLAWSCRLQRHRHF